jgi:HSP20 family protein
MEVVAMAITRWDPYREFTTLQDRMNRVFTDFYGARQSDDDVMTRGSWMPPVDIYQNGKQEIVLKAELPGIKREDLDLRVENNTLTIRGERKHEADVREDQYHRIERSYGAFSRSFSLPDKVDSGNVKAEFKDGILTVTLPIREEAKPRQIQVNVT